MLDIYTISKDDKYNWDSAIYWYLIEKKIKQNLSYVDFQSNKAFKKSIIHLENIYLICHDIDKSEIYYKCLGEYNNQNSNKIRYINRFDIADNLTVFKINIY